MNQGGDTYLFDVIDAGGLVFEDSLEAWLSAERGPWRVSQNGKSPIAGWFRMEHPIKMDDNWGVPLFWETSMFGNKVALFCLFLPFSLWRPAAHEKTSMVWQPNERRRWRILYIYIYIVCAAHSTCLAFQPLVYSLCDTKPWRAACCVFQAVPCGKSTTEFFSHLGTVKTTHLW